MPWARLDDNFYDHPKVIRTIERAGLKAIGLYILALSYCAKHVTDGFVPESKVKTLGLQDIDEIGFCVDTLVSENLLETADGGYLIHDYLKYNPSAASVKAKREADSKRQSRWRERQGTDEPESDAPAPKHESHPKVVTLSPGKSTAFARYEDAHAGMVNPIEWEQLKSLVAEYGDEWVAESVTSAVASGCKAPPINYLVKVLEHWRKDGFKATKKGNTRAHPEHNVAVGENIVLLGSKPSPGVL